MLSQLRNSPLGAASVVLSITLLIITGYVSKTLSNLKAGDETISVTGSAEKIVKSDTVKLTLSTVRRSTVKDVSDTTKKVGSDVDAIKKYIIAQGISDSEITANPVRVNDICLTNTNGNPDCSLGVSGYDLYTDIVVEASKVDIVAALANKITGDMSAQNINTRVSYVEYYYNGLKDLRVALLNEATQNAKVRAEEIAKSSGSSLGKLKSASTGVFQVTQKNSVDVSDYGSYDTQTVEKKVTAVVRTTFQLK